MKTKKIAKKKVAKKATKKKATKKVETKKPVTLLSNMDSLLTEDVSQVDIQRKYDQCVEILHQLHDSIALCLSMTNEFDNKSALDLIKHSVEQYEEFTKLSPAEVEAIRAESAEFIKALESISEMIETDNEPATIQTKKELLN